MQTKKKRARVSRNGSTSKVQKDFPRQITITGALGSGKSTVAKALAQRLGYRHYSVGDFMRTLAHQKKISLLALGERAMHDGGAIDRELDALQERLGRSKTPFIIDSRLGYRFLPRAFKIYLDVRLDVAAQRIFHNRRPDEQENTTLARTKQNILRRRTQEKKRYAAYYGIRFPERKKMDFLIDTSDSTVDVVVEKIVRAMQRWQVKQRSSKRRP